MSSEIEAAGAAITAGVVARTLDGKKGRRAEQGHGPCANCGAEVNGAYCAACGQPGHVHRSLGHFLEEAVHGVFHFDTRAWRTLPMLAFRPGTLTRRYTMGERARFISPVALFLFTVFLMFFVFALIGEQSGPVSRTPTLELGADVEQARADLLEAQSDLAREEAELARIQANPAAGPGEAASQEGLVTGARAELTGAESSLRRATERLDKRKAHIAELTRARDQLKINAEKARAQNDADDLQSIEFSLTRLEEALADPAGPPDGVTATIGPDGGVTTGFNLGAASTQTIFQQIREANARGAVEVNLGVESWNEKVRHKLENPELAWYKIQNTAYKFSFLLIPISLPFVWLMFSWKRGTTLFDHSVFVLYSLSFMSLLFILLAVAFRGPSFLAETIAPVLLVSIPVHMFFQLKGGYALGVFSALWRTVYLMLAAVFCLSLFLLAILMLGLLG
jgi:hypothetical protein